MTPKKPFADPFAILLQLRAYRVTRGHLRQITANFQLTMTDWALLAFLSSRQKTHLFEIASHLKIEPPLVTTTVRTLEQHHLLARERDAKDHRAQIVQLTDQGRTLLIEINLAIEQHLAPLYGSLSPTEMACFKNALQKITNPQAIQPNQPIESPDQTD